MVNIFNKWKDKVAHYIDIRIQLFKLEFIERTSNVVGYILFSIAMLLATIAIMFFVGIGLGEWFSQIFKSRITGYFATAGLYILITFIAFLMRKFIVQAFTSLIVSILTEDRDEHEEHEDDEENKK